MVLPMLLVDFDGVLNPFAAERCPAGFVEYSLEDFPGDDPVRLNRDHARWLRDLSHLYEAVWASACSQDLNVYCGRLIELPAMPRVPMPEPPFHPDLKVSAVDAFVGGRALAWVDDAFGDVARQWARHRSVPTLLLDVDPATGLTFDVVKVLADRATALPAP